VPEGNARLDISPKESLGEMPFKSLNFFDKKSVDLNRD